MKKNYSKNITFTILGCFIISIFIAFILRNEVNNYILSSFMYFIGMIFCFSSVVFFEYLKKNMKIKNFLIFSICRGIVLAILGSFMLSYIPYFLKIKTFKEATVGFIVMSICLFIPTIFYKDN